MSSKLLRYVDVEDILEVLGIDVEYVRDGDAYFACPDPNHVDGSPSAHVHIEDDRRLGWVNCWSHPDRSMSTKDFFVFCTRVRQDMWDRWPRPREVRATVDWLVEQFDLENDDEFRMMRIRSRERETSVREPEEPAELLIPELSPLDQECRQYLSRRHIDGPRADLLGCRLVCSAGDLHCIRDTVPGVWFPIRHRGKVVNWFLRSLRDVPSRHKGRYAPRAALHKAGVVWSAVEPLRMKPICLVEGIFDAERVSELLRRNKTNIPPENVFAALGGKLTDQQAATLRSLMPSTCVVLCDGDEAGLGFGESVTSRLNRVTVRQAPPGTDPGDCPEDILLGMIRG